MSKTQSIILGRIEIYKVTTYFKGKGHPKGALCLWCI